MEIWLSLVIFLLALCGGALIGGTALALGGVGSLRVLLRRLETLEGRQDDLSDKMTTEVKKRAGLAGVQAQKDARTNADAVREAAEVLAANGQQLGPPTAADRRRPSVVTGR